MAQGNNTPPGGGKHTPKSGKSNNDGPKKGKPDTAASDNNSLADRVGQKRDASKERAQSPSSGEKNPLDKTTPEQAGKKRTTPAEERAKSPSGGEKNPLDKTSDTQAGKKPDTPAEERAKSPSSGEKNPLDKTAPPTKGSATGDKAKSAAGNAVKGAAAKKAPVVGDAATALGKSKSDGSTAGDAKDIASRAKAGAQVGKLAGGAGAGVGAAVGAGVGVLKSKKAKKLIVLLVCLPLLMVLAGGALIGVAIGSSSQQDEAKAKADSNAQESAKGDGLGAGDVAKYILWAAAADVDWTLIAAADWAAGDWSGPGDPPLGIDDVGKFNAQAKKHGTRQLKDDPNTLDRIRAWGELVNAKVNAEPGRANASHVAAGAIAHEDNGKVKIVPKDNSDAQALHADTKKAIIAVMTDMPTSTSSDADMIWDYAWRWATGQPPASNGADDCSPADPGGYSVDTSGVNVNGLTRVQIDTAAVILEGAKKTTDDPAAWMVALMVAFQESSMGANEKGMTKPDENGDVGPFQQRSFVGWYGTGATQDENIEQLGDPRYGAKVFLEGRKVTKDDVKNAKKAGQPAAGPAGYQIPGLFTIDGWESMEPTVAAQKVQRSAFPDAYAKWEDVSKELISKLENVTVTESPGADPGDCEGTGGSMKDCPPTNMKAVENPPQLDGSITPDALRTLRCAVAKYPFLETIYSWAPPVPPSNAGDHSEGRALDLMLNKLSAGEYAPKDPAEIKKYDEIVAWMMKDHKELGVQYIIWQNKIFNFDRDKGTDFYKAARPYSFCSPPGGSEDSCGPTLAHLNHIHVSFYGNKGTGYPDDDGGGGKVVGGWTLYTDKPYSMGAGICNGVGSCQGYGSHTGQDVSLGGGEGSPIRAVAGGKVSTRLFCPDLSDSARRSNEGCSYGRLVTIDHGGGVVTYYAHLSKYGKGIKDGVTVKPGQVIGHEGEQGHAFGSHLHFEVRVKGSIVDPNEYLAKKGVDPRCSKLATSVDGRLDGGKCKS